MTGVRVGTRHEHLEALLKRTQHEIARARQMNDRAGLADFLSLEQRIKDTMAGVAPAAGARRAEPVLERMAELGVTSREVKEWAVRVGRRQAVVRGRISAELVEAWATAHAERHHLIQEHSVGPCLECREPMLSPGFWSAATSAQRGTWRGWGICRQGGRGLCTRCYARLSNHGEIDRYDTSRVGTEGLCARCGCRAGLDDERLCGDCVYVLALDAQ